MIKRFFISIVLLPVLNTSAGNIPTSFDSRNKEINLRGFYRHGNFNTMGEISLRQNELRSDETQYLIGTRYRLYNNLKIGAFYQMTQGLRHEEDWISSEGRWQWIDSQDRREDHLILELSPRTILDFLPGERWVGELRIRGETNFFNEHNTIKLRPGLNYFWLDHGKPFINIYLQHELYFPLNYSKETIYQQWTYLGILYHLSRHFKLSPYINMGVIKWTNTDNFQGRTGSTYLSEESFTNLGLTLMFNY
jgi:hypothetical protein